MILDDHDYHRYCCRVVLASSILCIRFFLTATKGKDGQCWLHRLQCSTVVNKFSHDWLWIFLLCRSSCVATSRIKKPHHPRNVNENSDRKRFFFSRTTTEKYHTKNASCIMLYSQSVIHSVNRSCISHSFSTRRVYNMQKVFWHN